MQIKNFVKLQRTYFGFMSSTALLEGTFQLMFVTEFAPQIFVFWF